MSENTPKKWQSRGILIGAAVAIGAFVLLVRPARQQSEQPSAREPGDVTQRVQQRQQQLSAAHGLPSRHGTLGQIAERPPLAVGLQHGLLTTLPTSGAPIGKSQAETSELSDVKQSPRRSPILSEEGPLIEVPAGVQRIPMRTLNNSSGKTDGAQQAAQEVGAKTGGVQQAAEKVAEKADGVQKAADKVGDKTDGVQQGAEKAGEKTDGVQKTDEKASEKTEGGKQTGDKVAEKTDGGGTGDNVSGKTDGGEQTDVIKVSAASMEWDPKYARKRNGEVFLLANSSLRTEVDLSSPAASISLWAHGDKANGEWPKIRVSVDGTPMGEVLVNSTEEKKFFVPIFADPGHSVVELTFINDFYDPNTKHDRNVYIRQIKVRTQGR